MNTNFDNMDLISFLQRDTHPDKIYDDGGNNMNFIESDGNNGANNLFNNSDFGILMGDSSFGARDQIKQNMNKDPFTVNSLNNEHGRGSISSFSPSTDVSNQSSHSNSILPSDEKTAYNPEDKKKAQNRAAQKAFRERKEARLKELEIKLNESESNREILQREVEELRKLNKEIHAENRSLLQRNDRDCFESVKNERFSNSVLDQNQNNSTPNTSHTQDTDGPFSFPQREQYYNSLMTDMNDIARKHGQEMENKIYNDNEGQTILTIPATWQYLQKLDHGDLDVIEVMQMLRGNEVCHGSGGAYPKAVIDSIIQKISGE